MAAWNPPLRHRRRPHARRVPSDGVGKGLRLRMVQLGVG